MESIYYKLKAWGAGGLKRTAALILAAVLAAFLPPVSAQAESGAITPFISAETGRAGDTVKISFPYDGSLGEIAVMATEVSYDEERFEYTGVSYSDVLKKGVASDIDMGEGMIRAGYVFVKSEEILSSAAETFTYTFKVLEDAEVGETSFSVRVYDLTAPDKTALDGEVEEELSFTVPEALSHDVTVYEFTPEEGELEPPFSPDIYDYEMTVPFDTKTVEFEYEIAEGARLTQNRKTLLPAGSDTAINIKVTAEDGRTKLEYNVTVHREPYPDGYYEAYLSSISSDAGELEPEFSPDVFEYRMTVPSYVKRVNFDVETPEGVDYDINRETLHAAGSHTEFRITATAPDGETEVEYLVDVFREAESEEDNSAAYLTSLVSEEGELDPEFSPDVFEYEMTVPYETDKVYFEAEAPEGVTYSVNRTNLGAGGSYTDFVITSKTADGKTRQHYTVTVYREPKVESPVYLLSLICNEGELEPEFSPDEYEYTMTVPYEVKTISFVAEAPEGISYSVNRKNLGAGGSYTDFVITAKGEDGARQKYTVTVYREEKGESDDGEVYLLSLSSEQGELEPEFSPDIFEYEMTVPYETKKVYFSADAPEGVTYSVNRKNLGAGGSYTDFIITAKNENGAKQRYTVTVYRQEKGESSESSEEDVYLTELYSEQGELEPKFSPDIFEYEMTVPYETKKVYFSADAPEGVTYSVNRKNLGAGGSYTDFIITAKNENGGKQRYTVTVYREEKGESSSAAVTTGTGGRPSPSASGNKSSPRPSSNLKEVPVVEEETETEDIESSKPSGNDSTIVINGGGISPIPAVIAVCFLGLVILLSIPLARRIHSGKQNKEDSQNGGDVAADDDSEVKKDGNSSDGDNNSKKEN